MSVLRLLGLRSPADFAPWFAAGAEYVDRVTQAMGFDDGAAPSFAAGREAMAAGRTDVEPELAATVAATLLADARFCRPFVAWTPRWYRLGLALPIATIDRKLRRVGREYAAAAESVSVPEFSLPADASVDGEAATEGVSGFRRRFVLADAVLHLKWYVAVARVAGIVVPEELVERTRRETLALYAGSGRRPSERVLRFQRALFTDDEWVARIDDAYGLDSALFGAWERLLADERRRLERMEPR